MTEHEIMVAARALIAAPERWTQGELARDVDGVITEVACDDAVCWCAIGAIERVSPIHPSLPPREALRVAMGGSISYFNDTRTHAEVLAAFDAAIAATGGV